MFESADNRLKLRFLMPHLRLVFASLFSSWRSYEEVVLFDGFSGPRASWREQ